MFFLTMERKGHKLPYGKDFMPSNRATSRAVVARFIRKTVLILIGSTMLRLIGVPISETMSFLCASAALFAVLRSYATTNQLTSSHLTHFDEAMWLYMLALVWRF
ncbi:UNVERIFIED_CONTAM: hypothetical protein Q9R58_28550 [Methylobacteriaceae bacterium AG10]|nr:hypothetical protein [Methylobacteriaceae bacterium AG10]